MSKNHPSNNNDDIICVVCFRDVQIFSIGECDHPVCYDCSTRMRVLCGQNECPICRQDVAKVYFTEKRLPYRQLDTNTRSGLYDKRYRICFVNLDAQNAFYKLLDNPCPKCDNRTFVSFDLLSKHVSKEHDLFYCDLCTENLKIFSFERRCYTRQDLTLHKRKGDADDKSHRGHPLCEYCNVRYLDRDELFRHLRREHYFCHFCDADGSNHFYEDYNSLRDHFFNDHFVCDEGDCAQEQFTGVFRTEIDLRAHMAKHHSSGLGKIAAKQARTLEVEFSLVPRNRPGYSNNSNGPGGGGSGGGGGRYHNHAGGEGSSANHQQVNSYDMPVQEPRRAIDSRNEQEFPSLGGGAGVPASASMASVRSNVSIRGMSFKTGNLSRTNDNFPALGGNSSIPPTTTTTAGKFNQISASAVLKKQPPKPDPMASSASTSSAKGTVIHISNRPKSGHTGDFPALPGGRGPSVDQMLANTDLMPAVNINRTALSAKHRGLIDEYSVAPVANQKSSAKLALISALNTVPVVAQSPKKAEPTKLKLQSEDNFPTLGDSAPATKPVWLTGGQSSSNRNKVESRKSKVAPHPNSAASNEGSSKKEKKQKANVETKSKSNEVAVKSQPQKAASNNQPQKSKSSGNVKEGRTKDKSTENKQNGVGSKSKEPKSTKGKENEDVVSKSEDFPLLGKSNGSQTSGTGQWVVNASAQPPPGFGTKANSNSSSQQTPPPGFSTVTLNSVARAPSNNLTFTNSTGDKYNILPSRKYIPPAGMEKRNQVLVKIFQETFQHQEAFDEFRRISQMFRENTYHALPYFEHCHFALKDKFDQVFPELLALLPDILKQQELYLVYSQQAAQSKGKDKIELACLSVCPTCKQVLIESDVSSHLQNHAIEQNFPTLSNQQKTTSAKK